MFQPFGVGVGVEEVELCIFDSEIEDEGDVEEGTAFPCSGCGSNDQE